MSLSVTKWIYLLKNCVLGLHVMNISTLKISNLKFNCLMWTGVNISVSDSVLVIFCLFYCGLEYFVGAEPCLLGIKPMHAYMILQVAHLIDQLINPIIKCTWAYMVGWPNSMVINWQCLCEQVQGFKQCDHSDLCIRTMFYL